MFSGLGVTLKLALTMGACHTSYRYTGQEWDGQPVSAYNLRAREYYPKLGRFMQNDPIGDKGGSLNWYLYVSNNPVNRMDITGKVCGSDWNDPIIPDEFIWGYTFRWACELHDKCYGMCNKSKQICDTEYLLDMLWECKRFDFYNPVRYNCIATALLYYYAVDKLGEEAYKKAQCKCHK
jgi:RHS repeat-associated protein